MKQKYKEGDELQLTIPLKVIDVKRCEDFAPSIGAYEWYEYLVQYDYLDKTKTVWISQEKLEPFNDEVD